MIRCIWRLKINDLGCCSCSERTSEPDGEMGTLSAGEEGRPRSKSNGSSRLGLFFFSVSRSLISPEPWLWPSARVRTPDKKSAISSCSWRNMSSLVSKVITDVQRHSRENCIWRMTGTDLNAAVYHCLRQPLRLHLCWIDSVEEKMSHFTLGRKTDFVYSTDRRLWLTWGCRPLRPPSPCCYLPSASLWTPPCLLCYTAGHFGRPQTTRGSSCPAVGHPHPAKQ